MVLAVPALLASPSTWITAAVVLAVLALVVLALAFGRRRAPVRGDDVTVPSAGAPSTGAAATDAGTGAGETDADDPVTEPITVATAEHPRPEPAVAVAPLPGTAGTESVKDRLLAALLDDPDAAVRALSDLPDGGPDAPLGATAVALLRTGLTPPQVARLCGVDEATLARRMATDLGLLPGPQGSATGTGRNRTDVPGRAWANAGSAPGSTTPTTG